MVANTDISDWIICPDHNFVGDAERIMIRQADPLLIRNAGEAQTSAVFCRIKAIRLGALAQPTDRRIMIFISRGPHDDPIRRSDTPQTRPVQEMRRA